jgi:hypothetical protein
MAQQELQVKASLVGLRQELKLAQVVVELVGLVAVTTIRRLAVAEA